MGRIGGIMAGLVMCALLVSACGSGSPAAQKLAPARVTTETVRIGRYTQIFDTSLPSNPAQASVVEGFRAALILWDKSQEDLALVSPVTAYVTGRALGNLKLPSSIWKAASWSLPGRIDSSRPLSPRSPVPARRLPPAMTGASPRK